MYVVFFPRNIVRIQADKQLPGVVSMKVLSLRTLLIQWSMPRRVDPLLGQYFLINSHTKVCSVWSHASKNCSTHTNTIKNNPFSTSFVCKIYILLIFFVLFFFFTTIATSMKFHQDPRVHSAHVCSRPRMICSGFHSDQPLRHHHLTTLCRLQL